MIFLIAQLAEQRRGQHIDNEGKTLPASSKGLREGDTQGGVAPPCVSQDHLTFSSQPIHQPSLIVGSFPEKSYSSYLLPYCLCPEQI